MPGVPTVSAQAKSTWHGDGELLWQPGDGRLILCAEHHDTKECLAAADMVGSAWVLEVPPPEVGFEGLAGLDAVLGALRAALGQDFDGLRERHAKVLSLLMSEGRQEQLGRLVPVSEAAALGTTRRVSRESHTTAVWIDQAARLIVDAAQAAVCDGIQVTLNIQSADLWDRPSLRILYRAMVVAPPRQSLTVICRLRHWQPTGGRVVTVIDQLRADFLASIAGQPRSLTHAAAAEVLERAPEFDVSHIAEVALGRGPDAFLSVVGNALALQNFERAELLTRAGLMACADHEAPLMQDATAHIFRLSAIAAAQVADIDRAVEMLNSALHYAQRSEVIAHLYYLLGLLSTKRHYDMDAAHAYYKQARASLASAPDTAEVLVEKGWILNGIALIEAMEARASDNASSRADLFASAFREEFEAFNLVRSITGPSAFYLRFNLANNLAFLLQISGRYKEAMSFLRSIASSMFAGRLDFEMLFKYSLGILLLKDGSHDEAAECLDRAAELALAEDDYFYAEKMYVALAYAWYSAKKYDAAADCYRNGALIAKWLGDTQAYQAHLAGLLWMVVLGDLPYNDGLSAAVAATFPDVALVFAAEHDRARRIAALQHSGAAIAVPSAKLPSYIPAVDLEGTPGRDMNRVLAGVPTSEVPIPIATGDLK